MTAYGVKIFDRAAIYIVGKIGTGWSCSTCGRGFAHKGKPRRTFLALLDHTVIDHRRLPKPYSLAELSFYTPPMATAPPTYGTGTTVHFTMTSMSVTPILEP